MDRLVLAKLATTSMHILQLMKSRSLPTTIPVEAPASTSALISTTEIDAVRCVANNKKLELPCNLGNYKRAY